MFSNLVLRLPFKEQFSIAFSDRTNHSWADLRAPQELFYFACLWFCVRNSFRARTGNINAGKLMYSVHAKFQRGKTYKRRKALESQTYNFLGFSTWFLSRKEVKPCDWFILHVTKLSRMFFLSNSTEIWKIVGKPFFPTHTSCPGQTV